LSPDGKTLATGGWGPVVLWEVATGKKVRDCEGSLFQVWDIAFSADGKTLAVGNMDSKVHLYDAATGKELPTVGGHREWLQFLAFIDRDRTIVSASSEGLVRQWDLATAKPVRDFQEKGTQAYCGDLSPDGRTLALGDGEGAHLFDWATGKKLHHLKGNKLQLLAVAFSPKGDMLATAGHMDQNIILWDIESGKELRRIATPYTMGLRCLAWSPNGKVLACGGRKSEDPLKPVDAVCLWGAATGEHLQEWTAHQRGETARNEMRGLAFSPDGALLASGGGDKTVGLWDAATGKVRSRLLGHQRDVTAIAFSPDSRMLASGSDDRTVRLWELATCKERRRYEGHLGGIPKLAFSKDGRVLASSSGDTSVLVWSITGRDLQRESYVTLSPRELENLWNDLAGDDASRAWQAMAAFATAPKQTIPWLQAQLQPALAIDRKEVKRLIRNLDSNEFATRRQAAQELEKLGELGESTLRAKLIQQPSAEARRQIERLLEQLQGPVRSPEVLRGLRSIELLEHIGTPEARRLLEQLTHDTAAGRIEREAKASLDRLANQNATKP
jgi:WD40 repeat protein